MGCQPQGPLALTTHCVNAVGIRCISHLFSNTGDKIESTQIDRFASAVHTILSHSHNASQQWRAATKTAPPTSPSHRWASGYERNDQLVKVWPEVKTFVDKFSNSEDTKSAKAKFCREEVRESDLTASTKSSRCIWSLHWLLISGFT